MIETNDPKRFQFLQSLKLTKTKNPKNNTIEVYTILTPVSFKALKTDFLIFHLLKINSCLYFAKKCIVSSTEIPKAY